ncbi:MAG: rhomboid family intramembrane serine protease [Bacteroidales bacterium]|nr:rhomboid family intramembrane serine protease [Bacteroidales bacterium]
MNNIEKIRLKLSLTVPLLFLIIMWLIKIIEYSLNLHLYTYGIYPQRLNCLTGIITAPFIHGSFEHLFSNTIPFLLLGTGLFYFYKESAYKVFLIIWLFSGFWVWLAARPAYHIGASGMIYGFASFLFFSGLLQKNRSLAALSLLIIFIYGGMVWGVLPLKPEVSWESHLFGAITGLVSAFIFAPKNIKISTENETNDNDDKFLYDFSNPESFFEDISEIKWYYKNENETNNKKSEQ